MKQSIQAVKGTRDYYPEQMAVRNFLYTTARKVSESFGYQEWDAPFLETIGLYAAKSGDELVNKQSFVFPDRSGDLITLRPELTPSLARMIAQRQKQLVYPLRWWTWGPCWRYEKPQKGRTREFFQWNVDLVGVDTPEADAEMVAIAASFIKQAGLGSDQVNILVNNRKMINEELAGLGVPEQIRIETIKLIDRRDKMSAQEWDANAVEIGLDGKQIKGLRTILDDLDLWRKSPELISCFTLVEALGLKDYVRFAPHIIRGLDYYTGTVFEAWDLKGEFRAILGGGRYDNLVSDVGGEQMPAIGFAMGDLVISLVLEKFGTLPAELSASPAQVLVTIFDQNSQVEAFQIAGELRAAGINTALYPEAAKLSKQFKYGDRMGMKAAVVVGPEEKAQSSAAVKDLKTGEQRVVPRTALVEALHSLFD